MDTKKTVTNEKKTTETKVAAAKTAEVKKTVEPKKADVKPAEVKKTEPKKTAEPKKADVKTAEPKNTAAKTPAKKTSARKKTVSKKDIPSSVYVEFGENQVSVDDLIPKVRKAWQKAGKRVKDIKDIKVYIKPEDGKVYFVINDDFSGAIDFE